MIPNKDLISRTGPDGGGGNAAGNVYHSIVAAGGRATTDPAKLALIEMRQREVQQKRKRWKVPGNLRTHQNHHNKHENNDNDAGDNKENVYNSKLSTIGEDGPASDTTSGDIYATFDPADPNGRRNSNSKGNRRRSFFVETVEGEVTVPVDNTNDNDGEEDEESLRRTRRITTLSQQYVQYTQALARQQLAVVPVSGDGNCLFRAVAHQVYGDENYHSLVRQKCVDYMESETDFFSQFVEGGKEMFPYYLQAKRTDACWGDDPEIEVCALGCEWCKCSR